MGVFRTNFFDLSCPLLFLNSSGVLFRIENLFLKADSILSGFIFVEKFINQQTRTVRGLLTFKEFVVESGE